MHEKLWACKVAIISISGILGPSTWKFQDQMTFGCRACGQAQRILQGGRWWLPPSSGLGEYCESMFACGSSMHQKCSNYALTNLIGLCRSMSIIDPLVTCPNPHPGALACPSTPEVQQARERTSTSYPFVVFTFGFIVDFIKELGGASFTLSSINGHSLI